MGDHGRPSAVLLRVACLYRAAGARTARPRCLCRARGMSMLGSGPSLYQACGFGQLTVVTAASLPDSPTPQCEDIRMPSGGVESRIPFPVRRRAALFRRVIPCACAAAAYAELP